MSKSEEKKNGFINILQEFSIPLIVGVGIALLIANIAPEFYKYLLEVDLTFGTLKYLGHTITPKFLINDIFMVLFFGIAAKEITEAFLPGGDLNPPKKAINPLLGTLGGVLGPVGIYFLFTWYFMVILIFIKK